MALLIRPKCCKRCRKRLRTQANYCWRCQSNRLCRACRRAPKAGGNWCAECADALARFQGVMDLLCPTNGQFPHADLEQRLAYYEGRAKQLLPLFEEVSTQA